MDITHTNFTGQAKYYLVYKGNIYTSEGKNKKKFSFYTTSENVNLSSLSFERVAGASGK